MSTPRDAQIRLRALDPESSFIVQAPAGSGKTELLTRRVLTLLTRVDEPEQILAITFTRKAASEMRQRVVEMLIRAASGEAAADAHEREGLELAERVLQRDALRQWQLIRNPQRLNLKTIDALATQLAHRLPVTSALGAPTGVVEDAGDLYRDVASRFIDSHIDELDRVLLQVGNRLEIAQSLLAGLLANRDQWKRHVYGDAVDHDQLRELLEGMLGDLIESRLAHLCAQLPRGLTQPLPERLRLACHYLLEDAGGDLSALPESIQCWLDMEDVPGAGLEDLLVWKGIASVFLTAQGQLRKQLNRKQGFPAKSDAKKRGVPAAELESHKQQMLELIDLCRDHEGFVAALVEVSELPDPFYDDAQWSLLSQLLGVLPQLLLELQLVFAERGVVDFPEMAERAQRALGTEDAPTDLALAMDLSLQHVLVDEFQDTSQTQFRLFSQLVSGWDDGDGRTFFAVGDPMQSIYRFRDGDVALFGQARDHGIGPVSLEPLTLSVNFRAAPAVIEWVNETFSAIFPERADVDSGAIPYSRSFAHLQKQGSVQVHGLLDAEQSDEAMRVAELAEQALVSDPEHGVGILVRTRSQAGTIFDALRAKGLAYESVDMDLVGERAVVRDLISLCLALRYRHDRLHWLAVLRSPHVGLSLRDLHALMAGAGSRDSVVDLLRDESRVATLSRDAQSRLRRFMEVMEPALQHSARGRLLPWVEAVWLQLGGPVVCRDDVDRDAAERALARLDALEAEGRLWEKRVLTATMQSLYAAAVEREDCRIQVMTLHKSKGLEFDTVILPSLDRQPRGDTAQLLNWFESTLDGRAQLLLAPLEQSGLARDRRDGINRLVRKARERCDEQERLRLLYVACTRARHHLHLLARTSANKTPRNASLLKPLWPLLESHFLKPDTHESSPPIPDTHESDAGMPEAISDTHECVDEKSASSTQAQLSLDMEVDPKQPQAPLLERLPARVCMPEFNEFVWQKKPKKDDRKVDSVKFSWAGRLARDIGTVVHQQLQLLAEQNDHERSRELANLADTVARQLRNMGVQKDLLPQAIEKVCLGVRNTLEDKRGRWILDTHEEARSEWALTVVGESGRDAAVTEFMGVSNEQRRFMGVSYEQVVIDRTFVDGDGTRWIVDFKTGDHGGGQVDTFIDNEQQRYADQLDRYADIISRMDSRPIRVGLYFPLLKAWREWQPPLADTQEPTR